MIAEALCAQYASSLLQAVINNSWMKSESIRSLWTVGHRHSLLNVFSFFQKNVELFGITPLMSIMIFIKPLSEMNNFKIEIWKFENLPNSCNAVEVLSKYVVTVTFLQLALCL